AWPQLSQNLENTSIVISDPFSYISDPFSSIVISDPFSFSFSGDGARWRRFPNLLYRGFPTRRSFVAPKASELRTLTRLEIGDTAGWKPVYVQGRPPGKNARLRGGL